MITIGKPDTNRAKLAVMMRRMEAKYPDKKRLTIKTVVICGVIHYQITVKE